MSVALLCYEGCTTKEEKQEQTTFQATSALQMDTTVVKKYVCQIHSISHIELRAQERGYLQKVYIDEGQFVKKGQPLFQIMPALYQADAQKAQAEVSFADIEYQNTKRLADSNIVSKNELALAKAKLEKAKAELSVAKVHLQFTDIKAPFDGIIDKFHVRLGSLLDEGDLLTTLSDNRTLWVYFNVPEAEYLDFKTSSAKENLKSVNLLMANQEEYKYPGTVNVIEADFDNETGNIPFRATFQNPEGLLRNGETGNIMMKIPYKNAIVIPQKATFEVLDRKYVYVIDKDNVARQREVTIAAEIPDLYLLKDGLKPNEKIVLEGLRKISNNDKIAFKYEDPKEVIKHLKLPTQ